LTNIAIGPRLIPLSRHDGIELPQIPDRATFDAWASAKDLRWVPSENDNASMAHIGRALRLISGDLYEVTCELCGFGSDAERRLTEVFGEGAESRLRNLHCDLQSLLLQLRSLRSAYLSEQLESLGLTSRSADLKLHFGSDGHQAGAWINVDTYPAPLAMSATWELPFRDASVVQAFVSRVPELLIFPIDIRKFLFEIRRVLIPGGIVRITIETLGFRNDITPRSIESAYRSWADRIGERSRLDYLLRFFGDELARSQARRAGRSQIDVSALLHLLKDEKFSDIRYVNSSVDKAGALGNHRACIQARKPVL
jgi:hypothetical protein